eukprot:TRINITY_DN901_c3_g1_i1.p1 TRINITY_DN901_c3_g1~~TRINITY_DN901_c3_g1_i1.p1  ORF type:complete len:332 (-),score=85.39 TRINITY_DN901_c3_g1_i1:224-1219(-)
MGISNNVTPPDASDIGVVTVESAASHAALSLAIKEAIAAAAAEESQESGEEEAEGDGEGDEAGGGKVKEYEGISTSGDDQQQRNVIISGHERAQQSATGDEEDGQNVRMEASDWPERPTVSRSTLVKTAQPTTAGHHSGLKNEVVNLMDMDHSMTAPFAPPVAPAGVPPVTPAAPAVDFGWANFPSLETNNAVSSSDWTQSAPSVSTISTQPLPIAPRGSAPPTQGVSPSSPSGSWEAASPSNNNNISAIASNERAALRRGGAAVLGLGKKVGAKVMEKLRDKETRGALMEESARRARGFLQQARGGGEKEAGGQGASRTPSVGEMHPVDG